MRLTVPLVLPLACIAGLSAVAQERETGPNGLPVVGGAEMSPDKTIVGNAVNSADHETLVAAVEAAGLVETLTGPGPFTVFAPVDAAFAALPAGTVEALLEPRNREALRTVLTCHVIAGDLMRRDMIERMASGPITLDTVGGCPIEATLAGDMISLTDPRGNTAGITIRDVEQLNGVIHVIDAVLLPAEDTLTISSASDTAEAGPTLAGLMANSPDLTTLAAAIEAADLKDVLSGGEPLTLFAPSDAALAGATMPQDAASLRSLVLAHAVPGALSAADLAQARRADGFVHLTTVSGDALSVQLRSSPPLIFDETGKTRRLVEADRMATNGVLHVIDGVLSPR